MKVDGVAYRGVWVDPADGWAARIIDQTRLPHTLHWARVATLEEAAAGTRTLLFPTRKNLERLVDFASVAAAMAATRATLSATVGGGARRLGAMQRVKAFATLPSAHS